MTLADVLAAAQQVEGWQIVATHAKGVVLRRDSGHPGVILEARITERKIGWRYWAFYQDGNARLRGIGFARLVETPEDVMMLLASTGPLHQPYRVEATP